MVAGLILLAGTGVLPGADITEESTGKTFPAVKEITAGGGPITLDCTGVGVRKKMVIKVYGLGFYVENAYRQKLKSKWQPLVGQIADLAEKDDFFRQLITDSYYRRFELKFVREVGAEKIREAFGEGMEDNMPAAKEPAEFGKARSQFLGWFQQEVKDGDSLIIDILADGTVEAFHNDRKLGSVHQPRLAAGVTSIWLGPECISESLRESIVKLFYK